MGKCLCTGGGGISPFLRGALLKDDQLRLVHYAEKLTLVKRMHKKMMPVELHCCVESWIVRLKDVTCLMEMKSTEPMN